MILVREIIQISWRKDLIADGIDENMFLTADFSEPYLMVEGFQGFKPCELFHLIELGLGFCQPE